MIHEDGTESDWCGHHSGDVDWEKHILTCRECGYQTKDFVARKAQSPLDHTKQSNDTSDTGSSFVS